MSEGGMNDYKANLRDLMLHEHIQHLHIQQVAKLNYEQVEEEEEKLQEKLQIHKKAIEKLQRELTEIRKAQFQPMTVQTKSVKSKQYREKTPCTSRERKETEQEPRRMYPVLDSEGLAKYKGLSPERRKHYLQDRLNKSTKEKYKFPLTTTQNYGWHLL